MIHCNNIFLLSTTFIHNLGWDLSCSHIWIEQYKLIGVLAVTLKFFYRVDFPSWSACGAPLLQRKSACW